MSKSYRVKLLPSARKDLFEIATYIAMDKPTTAMKYVDKLHSKLRLLSTHPKMGHLPRDRYLKSKGYRVLVVGSHLAFYVLERHLVKIRRILHGSQDIKSILFG